MDDPAVSPFRSGLLGQCPRCGRGKIFARFIDLREKCDCCGLSFTFADAGDGPAVFVCLISGFLMLIFMPLTVIVCGGLLRPLKGLLVALQFRNNTNGHKV